jgi:hypothetical protein
MERGDLLDAELVELRVTTLTAWDAPWGSAVGEPKPVATLLVLETFDPTTPAAFAQRAQGGHVVWSAEMAQN